LTAGGSSLPAVQKLLAVLAAGRRCAETGTAFGEGAAAIASTAASLVTVERDQQRAALARERLEGLENVELYVADWRDVLPRWAPFEFLFFDAGLIHETPTVVHLLGPGAFLVKDDMTPDRPRPEPAREFLFTHPETAAIVAVKR
jgi:predicted O-methyltransferase YrrM